MTVPDVALTHEDAAQMASMLRALNWAEGFTLLFAQVNSPARERTLREQARTVLESQGIEVVSVELEEPVHSLLAALQEQLADTSTSKPVVFISGLAHSLPSAEASHPVLDHFNLQRESYRRSIPYRLVFWLPRYALEAIARNAPDFWAWRTATFTFTTEPSLQAETLSQLDVHVPLSFSNLSVKGKRERLDEWAGLLTDYENHPDRDSPEILQNRARLASQIGNGYATLGDHDTALAFFEQSLTLRKQTSDRKGEAATLNNISQFYRVNGRYETALDYLQEALSIQQQIGDRKGEGATLNNISQIYSNLEAYETALHCLEQALSIQKGVGDLEGQSISHNNMSQIYNASGDHEIALKHLQQSLSIVQQIGDLESESAILHNIGSTLFFKGDHETSLYYLAQALSRRQELGDHQGEAITLNNISRINSANGDYDAALSYLQQALAIQQQVGDMRGMEATLGNMAKISEIKNTWQDTFEQYNSALEIAQKSRNTLGFFNIALNFGQLLLRLGNRKESERIFKQALIVGRQMGYPRVTYVETILKLLQTKPDKSH